MTGTSFTLDFKNLVVISLVVVFVVTLVYRLMRRDVRVRRARYGVFVERERYPEDELPPEPTHQLDPADQETRIPWPERDKEGP